jgi:hypothetical protein
MKEQVKEDYIQRNISSLAEPKYREIERKIKLHEMEMRILVAKGRRELQEKEKLKLNYFLVHKWEFLKEKKRQYIEHFQEIYRQKEYKR